LSSVFWGWWLDNLTRRSCWKGDAINIKLVNGKVIAEEFFKPGKEAPRPGQHAGTGIGAAVKAVLKLPQIQIN
jgi:hypothetical protein